jgi:hypothetical protein
VEDLGRGMTGRFVVVVWMDSCWRRRRGGRGEGGEQGRRCGQRGRRGIRGEGNRGESEVR